MANIMIVDEMCIRDSVYSELATGCHTLMDEASLTLRHQLSLG